jgi:hypothetical protein
VITIKTSNKVVIGLTDLDVIAKLKESAKAPGDICKMNKFMGGPCGLVDYNADNFQVGTAHYCQMNECCVVSGGSSYRCAPQRQFGGCQGYKTNIWFAGRKFKDCLVFSIFLGLWLKFYREMKER